MSLAADYSNGRLTPAQLRGGGFVGAVRYLAKRNPGSSVAVLTPSEAAAFRNAQAPLALVYEDNAAGWMTQGRAVGEDRGAWALAQARACGIEPRCIYFADDAVHAYTDAGRAEVTAVLATLEGARAAIVAGGGAPSVASLYGFRASIGAALAAGHTRYLWLTGSKPTAAEAAELELSLYQRNYGERPVIAGVQCDVNDILVPDWGQHFTTQELTMDAEVEARFDALETLINHDAGMIIFGDSPNGDPGHAAHLRNVRADVGSLTTKVGNIQTQLSGLGSSVTAIASRLDQLMTAVAGLALGQGDPDAIRAELAGVLNQTHLIVSTGTAASARGATEGS